MTKKRQKNLLDLGFYFVADNYFCRAKNKQKHHIFITNYTQERPTSKTSPPAVK